MRIHANMPTIVLVIRESGLNKNNGDSELTLHNMAYSTRHTPIRVNGNGLLGAQTRLFLICEIG